MKLAIIFDLDGTLIDTPRGIVDTFTAALKLFGVKSIDPVAIRKTIGLPLEKAFSMLMDVELEDQKVSEAVKLYQSLFKEIVLPKAKQLIFPGVEKGLANLKAKGFCLAVATSKVFASAEALIKAAGLWHYFDLVLGADDVKNPKPHPEMGQLAMWHLAVCPEDTIMVGDTTHDMLMAKSSGMRSIAVTYGVHDVVKLKSAEPTWIAHSFEEVMRFAMNKKHQYYKAANPDYFSYGMESSLSIQDAV